MESKDLIVNKEKREETYKKYIIPLRTKLHRILENEIEGGISICSKYEKEKIDEFANQKRKELDLIIESNWKSDTLENIIPELKSLLDIISTELTKETFISYAKYSTSLESLEFINDLHLEMSIMAGYRKGLNSNIALVKDHLKTKIEIENSKIISNSKHKFTASDNFFINRDHILKLYDICLEYNIINKDTTSQSFLSRWDFSSKQDQPLQLIKGRKAWFYYILNKVERMTEDQAFAQFGIVDIRGKLRNGRNAKSIQQVFKNDITRILEPKTKDITKIDINN